MLCRNCYYKYYCPYARQLSFGPYMRQFMYERPKHHDNDDNDDNNDHDEDEYEENHDHHHEHNGFPGFPGEEFPGFPGGGTPGAQYDFDDSSITPNTEPPAYEPEKTFFLSTETIRETIRRCRSRWAYMTLKDGRKFWIYINYLKHGDVGGYVGRRPNLRWFVTEVDNVVSIDCIVREGYPCY